MERVLLGRLRVGISDILNNILGLFRRARCAFAAKWLWARIISSSNDLGHTCSLLCEHWKGMYQRVWVVRSLPKTNQESICGKGRDVICLGLVALRRHGWKAMWKRASTKHSWLGRGIASGKCIQQFFCHQARMPLGCLTSNGLRINKYEKGGYLLLYPQDQSRDCCCRLQIGLRSVELIRSSVEILLMITTVFIAPNLVREPH